jgi:hypothetical protein
MEQDTYQALPMTSGVMVQQAQEGCVEIQVLDSES